jgi:pimeloyl-ACP methyl ester carboxylesterase
VHARAWIGCVSGRSFILNSIPSKKANIDSADGGRTFVLVHGAWHGGWCWRRVADRLRRLGHRVYCPTLTGLGERSHLLDNSVDLETHIADVANLIAWEDLCGITLVGHSYGGFVISGVVERLRPGTVSSMVFIDAFVPRNGENFIESITVPAFREFLTGFINRGALGAMPPPAESFGVKQNDRAWVDARCTPHPLASLTQRIRLTDARERIRRKVYLRAVGFRSRMFDDIRGRLQHEPGWLLHEIDVGHDVMIDAPDALTALLLQHG